jgi:hypothetical protein
MAKGLPNLKLNKALDLMRAGSCLMQVNNSRYGTVDFYIAPGGPVTEHVAKTIKARHDVCGAKDSLFPGHDQTWRLS